VDIANFRMPIADWFFVLHSWLFKLEGDQSFQNRAIGNRQLAIGTAFGQGGQN
jgi:hypothetical protein